MYCFCKEESIELSQKRYENQLNKLKKKLNYNFDKNTNKIGLLKEDFEKFLKNEITKYDHKSYI